MRVEKGSFKLASFASDNYLGSSWKMTAVGYLRLIYEQNMPSVVSAVRRYKTIGFIYNYREEGTTHLGLHCFFYIHSILVRYELTKVSL